MLGRQYIDRGKQSVNKAVTHLERIHSSMSSSKHAAWKMVTSSGDSCPRASPVLHPYVMTLVMTMLLMGLTGAVASSQDHVIAVTINSSLCKSCVQIKGEHFCCRLMRVYSQGACFY